VRACSVAESGGNKVDLGSYGTGDFDVMPLYAGGYVNLTTDPNKH
jgi:hypothetical protein